jgi:hypothetical protein
MSGDKKIVLAGLSFISAVLMMFVLGALSVSTNNITRAALFVIIILCVGIIWNSFTTYLRKG